MPVTEGAVVLGFVTDLFQPTGRFHGGRRMDVVEQGRGSGESFMPHQLLGVEPSVGSPEGDVPFARNLAERVVDRHRDLRVRVRGPVRAMRYPPRVPRLPGSSPGPA